MEGLPREPAEDAGGARWPQPLKPSPARLPPTRADPRARDPRPPTARRRAHARRRLQRQRLMRLPSRTGDPLPDSRQGGGIGADAPLDDVELEQELQEIMTQLQGLPLREDPVDVNEAALDGLAMPARDDERPARALATEAELTRLFPRIARVFPSLAVLRGSQARHIAAIQEGVDAILIAATGSGKSTSMFVLAVADYISHILDGGSTSHSRPVDLVLIPMANMGDAHKAAFDAFLASSTALAHKPTGAGVPAALYVDRGDFSAPATARSTPGAPASLHKQGCVLACTHGHGLAYERARSHSASLQALKCDACQGVIATADGRWSCALCDYDVCEACAGSSRVDSPSVPGPPTSLPDDVGALPKSLPCGRCSACASPSFSATKRAKLPHGCALSCKTWWPARERPWCTVCDRGVRSSLHRCQLRRSALTRSTGAVDGSPALPESGSAARTTEVEETSSSGGAIAVTPPADSPSTAGPTPPRPKQLNDLPEMATERLIAGDANVLLVVCTVSALHHPGDGGRLLREALAVRGVSRILIDEVHTISRHDHAASMATYSEALRCIPDVLGDLVARLRRKGSPRPQIVGFTSTLPEAAVQHVRERARMTSGACTVRCAIDRPELQFVRLPMPARHGERLVDGWCQRVLKHIIDVAPVWALSGRIVVFCPTVRFARRAHQVVRICRPDGVERSKYLFLGVEKMSTVERSVNIDGFGRSEGGVLFTNESWSHGSGKPQICLVVHLALAKGPVEQFQRSGRGARECDEAALVVHVLSVRSIVQYLQLTSPEQQAPLVGAHFVLEQLATGGCLRAAFLAFLGQTFLPTPCGACDHCVLNGPASVPGRGLGQMPLGNRWLSGVAAVVCLADSWPHYAPSLGEILTPGFATQPAPFDEPDAFNMLVWTLIAEKTIRLEPRAVGDKATLGCYASCSLDSERIDDYRERRRELDVLVHCSDWVTSGTCGPVDGASTGGWRGNGDAEVALTVAAIQRGLAHAARLVEREQRRFLQGMASSCGGRLLAELRLTPLQQRLLDALHSETTAEVERGTEPRSEAEVERPTGASRKRNDDSQLCVTREANREGATSVALSPGGGHAAATSHPRRDASECGNAVGDGGGGKRRGVIVRRL